MFFKCHRRALKLRKCALTGAVAGQDQLGALHRGFLDGCKGTSAVCALMSPHQLLYSALEQFQLIAKTLLRCEQSGGAELAHGERQSTIRNRCIFGPEMRRSSRKADMLRLTLRNMG